MTVVEQETFRNDYHCDDAVGWHASLSVTAREKEMKQTKRLKLK